MLKVFVKPENVWKYFQENRERLKGVCDIIAEIELEGVDLQVVLTECDKRPQISIELSESNEPIIKERIASADECEETVKTYFKVAETLADEEALESITETKIADEVDFLMVAHREAELLTALKNFMTVAMGFSDGSDLELEDGEFSAILDNIETTLYECGYAIYRPQIIEDDEGQMILYESSIFSEGDDGF